MSRFLSRLSKFCQLTVVSSRLTPRYLPTCTEKFFFVPLRTLKNAPAFATPTAEGRGHKSNETKTFPLWVNQKTEVLVRMCAVA